MKVTHRIGRQSISGKAGNPSFMLGNSRGGYFFSSPKQTSRYNGFYTNEDLEMYKTVNSIIPLAGKVTAQHHKLPVIEQEREESNKKKSKRKGNTGNFTEKFFMPQGYDGIIYETRKKVDVQVTFDCKKSYDNREFGRYYKIGKEKGKTVITFTKRTDQKEDSTHGKEEYTLYVVLNAPCKAVHENFLLEEYPYDAERKSLPTYRYVYGGVTVNAKKLIITCSIHKKKAMQENNALEKVKNTSLKQFKNVQDKKVSLAASSVHYALHQLLYETKQYTGIFAGFPWFFQFWARDEAISLGAFIQDKHYKLAKHILWRNLKSINDDGRIPNRYPEYAGSPLSSADGIGWVFKRTADLFKACPQIFSKKEILFVKKQLQKSIDALLQHHTKQGLAYNKSLETWMDTGFGNDDRKGCRIEIQALRLHMYSFLKQLCKKTKDKKGEKQAAKIEKELYENVRQYFFHDGKLYDGLHDETARPNIFIAYYVYPELLRNKEWKKCFTKALPKLFLSWGGFSTIDKQHALFFFEHSGEKAESYHRGDSWYWINNLAAICLQKVAKKTFSQEIKAILQASTQEILWQGIIGTHAELSSSKQQKSFGCWNQAWSNAMYLELINELF
jgi:glycogen debranching enzyme